MKKAFTLAEVLITLGIIGVVAALTMPMLIAKTEQIVLNNRFKRVYNTYSNALIQVISDEGDTPQCYYYFPATGGREDHWGDCYSFYANYTSKIKIIKYCESNGLVNGCIPKYPDSTFNAEDNDTSAPGFKKSVVYSISRSWVLADGSTMFTYYSGVAPVFGVDINGFARPNQLNKDLFFFSISKMSNANTLKLNVNEEYLLK